VSSKREQIDFVSRRFDLSDACENEEIPLWERTVKRVLLASFLSTIGHRQARFWQKQAIDFLPTAYCRLPSVLSGGGV
jgi:hypothetical protein